MFTLGSSGGVVAWLPWSGVDQWSASWLWTVFVTIIGSFLFLFNHNRRQKKAMVKHNDQHAIEIEPGVYKSGLLKGDKRNVIEKIFPEVTTLYHGFLRGMQVSENGPCLGYRASKKDPYTFMDYAEVFKKSQSLGSSFITKLGMTPANSTHVGVYARNCPEWFITALACSRYSMVIVPLYDTLGADAATFIIQHTEAQTIVVDNETKIKKLLELAATIPSLKHILLIDALEDSSLRAKAEEHGIQIHSFSDLERIDESLVQPDVEPKPDDTYIICYTSGTTGTPKGVILTHGNMVASSGAFVFMLNKFIPDFVSPQQSILSYLPLSHIFEQTCHWCVITLGGRVGYFSGDVGDLSGDMQALQPTIFPVVPRLLNRFNDTINHQVNHKSGPLGKFMFNFAYRQKLSSLKKGIVTNETIWDKLVFKKAQEQLGGKVKLIITGSAPVNAEVLQNCRIAFGCHIVEGYGQTECSALATATWPYETVGGHCGGPAVNTIIKLDDVPDLNYYSKNRQGEILIKGPGVTKGYYKDPEKTAELFNSDGFIQTGDIGHLLPNGSLKIIDRKKHIFKLAQGEYVAPEKIENVYVQSPVVQQVYVDGDSLERYLIAIVVPIEKALGRIYKEVHPDETEQKPLAEMCKDKQTVERVLLDLQKLGKEQKLNSIEQVKKLCIEPDPFTLENGLLTPTLKSKRPELRRKYKDIMQNLYKTE